MQLHLIFIIGAILLIPIVYSSSSISDACALPPESGYMDSKTCGATTTNPKTGNPSSTCCWTEKERTFPNIGTKEVRYCQTCEATDSGLDCKPKVAQFTKLPETTRPEQEGGVFRRAIYSIYSICSKIWSS